MPEEFPWHLADDLAEIPPGHYWVHSEDGRHTAEDQLGHTMQAALALFLKSGRFPLVSHTRFAKQMHGMRQGQPFTHTSTENKPTEFTYHKTAYDAVGASGSISV